MKPSRKNDLISIVFLLVFGTFYAALGVNFFGLGAHTGALILILMAVSLTKYKTYAKYYVPTLLTCGIILTIIGLNVAYAMHDYLIFAIGQGVLAGGICNLIVVLAGRKRSRTNRMGGESK